MGLTNIEISRYLYARTLDFRGVFSADNIDQSLATEKDGYSIICNLSKVSEKGTHFVCIIGRPTYMIYIDSLGLPCRSESIAAFLKSTARSLFYNTRTIQDPLSPFCGFYCILFTLLFDSGMPNKIGSVVFTSDYANNDRKCIDYISQLVTRNK